MSVITPVDILAIGAHPDDVEMGAGAAIASQVRLGYTVGILDLTLGELSTRGNPELRRTEAIAAQQILGASWRIGLDLGDGVFEINEETLDSVIRIIRQAQPSVVLANAVRDRHPDHGRASQLVKRAVFLAGLEKINTPSTDKTHNIGNWRAGNLYYYIQDYSLEPDVILAVTKQDMEIKRKAIHAFKSQFYDPYSSEPESPLTTPYLIHQLEGRCLSWGRQIGAQYGEGFCAERYIGVRDLFDLV